MWQCSGGCGVDVSKCVLQLMDDPNIVIAKCDATANDLPPSYEVRG